MNHSHLRVSSPPSAVPSALPVLLFVLTLLLLWIAFRVSSCPPHAPSFPEPCDHPLPLEGNAVSPRLLCLRLSSSAFHSSKTPKPRPSNAPYLASDLLGLLALQRPKCVLPLPSAITVPPKGSQLFLDVSPSSPLCLWRVRPIPGAQKLLLGLPIPLSSASLDDLLAIPGLRRSVALRILERRKQAPFLDLFELRQIKGIGPKTYERIVPFLSVEALPPHPRKGTVSP